MKRVYHHYQKWEETIAGLWRRPTGAERHEHIKRCARFMAETGDFRTAMFRAIKEWPISCEVNFSTRTVNRQAWLGHAACCIAIGCPEEPTRAAWWTLSQAQRDAADAAAAEAILEWERLYVANGGKLPPVDSDAPALAPLPWRPIEVEASSAAEYLPLFEGQ